MKILTIIKKEYKHIVKKKSFVISTILTPLMMGLFIFLPMLISKVGRKEKTIVIEDFSGIVASRFVEKSKESKDASEVLKLKFTAAKEISDEQKGMVVEFQRKVEAGETTHLDLLPATKEKILNKEIDGLIIVPENVKAERKVYFCALNISDFGTNRFISSTVQKILSEKTLTDQNIDVKLVEEAIRDVNLGTFKVKKDGTSKGSSGMEYIMAMIMMSTLMGIILSYGQLMMRGVLEEKSGRIVEVLISSTRAQTLYYGKIIGIGLAGLTQVSLWILLGVIFLGRSSLGISDNITNFLTLEVGIYFFIFFVIGYYMFSILFAIVGASVNTDQEAQQFSAPLIYLVFIPFIIGILVTQDPNAPVVVISSLFPLFTPTLMFMRISVAVPPFTEILLSILMSVGFTVFLAWLGAKIFRVGILMYGKKPSIKEIMRWIRYK